MLWRTCSGVILNRWATVSTRLQECVIEAVIAYLMLLVMTGLPRLAMRLKTSLAFGSMDGIASVLFVRALG